MTEDTTQGKILQLQKLAKELSEDMETRKYLFSHTRNEAEYETLRRSIRNLSNLPLVTWAGPTGNRYHLPLEE